jgi:hypothetical protein
MATKGGGASGQGKASDIEAGKAHVGLYAKDLGLAKTLDKMKAYVLGFAKATAAATAGIFVGLVTSFKMVIDRFDAIKKASDRLGTTAEIWSALGYAIEQSGGSVDDLETGLKHLQKNLSAAADDGGEAQKALDHLGVSADDLMNLPLDQQLKRVAEAMSDVKNPADRARYAMEIFGKSGTTLLPLMKDGAKGITDLMEEAGKVGSIVTSEQAANAERAGDAISRAWIAAKNTFMMVGAAILPSVEMIEKYTMKIVEFFQAVRDAMNNTDVIWADMKVKFAEAMLYLTTEWNIFKGHFVDGWHDALKQIKLGITRFAVDANKLLAPVLAPIYGMSQDKFKTMMGQGGQVIEGGINSDFARGQAERNASRGADVSAAFQSVTAARQQFAEAMRDMVARGVKKAADEPGGSYKVPTLQGSALGAFQGPFKQLFGSLGVQNEQLKVQKQIDEGIKNLKDVLQNVKFGFS